MSGIAATDKTNMEWRNSMLPTCPKCRSENVRRSHRRSYEWPLMLFFLPLRCRKCHSRFYAFRYGRAVLVHDA